MSGVSDSEMSVITHEYFGSGTALKWAYDIPDEMFQTIITKSLGVPYFTAAPLAPLVKRAFIDLSSYHTDKNDEYWANPKCSTDPFLYSMLGSDTKIHLEAVEKFMDNRDGNNKEEIKTILRNYLDNVKDNDPCFPKR